MENTSKTGYAILSITIPKTSFEYENNSSENNSILIELNISASNTTTDKFLICDLRVEIILLEATKKVGFMNSTVRGHFEKQGNVDVLLSDFAVVNAPAILFPYMREHIASLSAKAGLNTIILEPVNFVAMAKNH
jgi:preprotein translocase subunit SecB